MSFHAPVAKIIPGIMAVAVAGESLKLVPKKGKPMKPKKLLKGFVGIMIGTALIKPTANIVNSL